MENNKGSHVFKAEFSMGQYDYIRYDKLLAIADEYAMMVLDNNIEYVKSYYSILRVIYMNFKPIIFKEIRVKWDVKFADVKLLFDNWEIQIKASGRRQFPVTLKDSLIFFHEDLLELKQIIGLGIPVSKEISESARIKRGMGI